MFTAARRAHVRERVIDLARTDPRVTAGALTGSAALGAEDDWSDIDVAFGIAGGSDLDAVLGDWTAALEREFGVLAHFDLRSGAAIYRVLLLPDGLEVDVAVAPARDFAARGPAFRPLFGPAQQREDAPPPAAGHLIGLDASRKD